MGTRISTSSPPRGLLPIRPCDGKSLTADVSKQVGKPSLHMSMEKSYMRGNAKWKASEEILNSYLVNN